MAEDSESENNDTTKTTLRTAEGCSGLYGTWGSQSQPESSRQNVACEILSSVRLLPGGAGREPGRGGDGGTFILHTLTYSSDIS